MPLIRKLVQVAECARNRVVGEVRLVLLQQAVACLGIVGLGNRVLEVGLLNSVERSDDAVYLGQRVVQVPLGIRRGQLDFLRRESARAGRPDCEGGTVYLVKTDGGIERRPRDVRRRRIRKLSAGVHGALLERRGAVGVVATHAQALAVPAQASRGEGATAGTLQLLAGTFSKPASFFGLPCCNPQQHLVAPREPLRVDSYRRDACLQGDQEV